MMFSHENIYVGCTQIQMHYNARIKLNTCTVNHWKSKWYFSGFIILHAWEKNGFTVLCGCVFNELKKKNVFLYITVTVIHMGKVNNAAVWNAFKSVFGMWCGTQVYTVVNINIQVTRAHIMILLLLLLHAWRRSLYQYLQCKSVSNRCGVRSKRIRKKDSDGHCRSRCSSRFAVISF